MTSSRQPRVVHEVNTVVWLGEVCGRTHAHLTLGEVPDVEWDALVLDGVDAVWLMGVWGRSPLGRSVALADPALRSSWDDALPGWTDKDVVGSPYCIRRYEVDPDLGGRAGLAAARAALARRGARLIVDLVPNHVAPDHAWVTTDPSAFVRGAPTDLDDDPSAWLDVGSAVLARARDPYFPPWPDVVQLNAFSADCRRLMSQTLLDIAAQADGVRCDMAMLLLDDVFAGTWSVRVGEPLERPFWDEVLGPVRATHPEFAVMAEAYWDREPDLLAQGFDACYDKRLYDALVAGSASAVRDAVGTESSSRTVRFLENHDEPRATATVAPSERLRASCVALATAPGTTLWHEGQLDGRRVHVPVFLARRPSEVPDASTRAFVAELIRVVDGVRSAGGTFVGRATSGWPDNESHESLLAWTWSYDAAVTLTIVNMSEQSAQGLVQLDDSFAGHAWRFVDLMTDRVYERDGDEIASAGLYIDLPAWGYHLWREKRVVEDPAADVDGVS